MEATGLSVGKSVLNGALGYAKSAIAEEVALQLGIQRDHAFVADELEMMRSFMMVAHEERDDNKVVKTWVKQVRDTAYDVEDTLQDFAVRLKKPSRWRILRAWLERRRIAKQMKELRAKVEDVSQRSLRYRLTNGSGSKAAATAAEQSSIIAAAVFGVDDARRAAKQDNQRVDLVKLISEEGADPKVIALWGTNGDIGVTSIVRAAYENADVQRKFQVRAWVRVMHPFSPKGFVQSLMNQFRAADGAEDLFEEEKIEQDLAHKFKEFVKENRCLIVLNDLSTIEEWDKIKKCFRNNRKGSRIVVSTAQVEVASLCAGQESQVSELKQLSADQTLYAFYVKGSHNEEDSKKQVSSDGATTSIIHYTVASDEIVNDQSKDTGELHKMVKKTLSQMRARAGALEESQLIGREKEISYLNKLISNSDKHQVQVISVYGMGGIGKTTLVDNVYQMQKLGERFQKCAFVTIARPFQLVELLRSLAARLHEAFSKEELMDRIAGTKKTLAMLEVEELKMELGRLLGGKSCLIILDDLSSITEWDQISPMFHQMDKTSQIVVTTREEDIAKHCSGQQGKIHNLQVLEQEEARHLFSKKVFGNAADLAKKNPELIDEANQILKKCGGLPLAIVTIGGFLANQPKAQMEWRKLNENISAELETNQELGKIRTILEKSYDGLPYHLKSCFLYLSIFPEDYTISRRRLVRRWAAEGYSAETHGKPANEIVDSYFKELKNRNMILPSQQSILSRNSIDCCKVHDLIRDIAISKSMEENLVFRLEEGCSMSTHGAIRHLSISSNWKGDQNEFESIVDLSRIRSLSVFGEWRPFYISDKMRFLRVLDLEGERGPLFPNLDHIGKLLHLRYLSLRGCEGIMLLPDSLGNLRQLQTLDIRDSGILILPKTMISLQKLQYIHAGKKLKFDEVKTPALEWRKKCILCLGLHSLLCVLCCLSSIVEIDDFDTPDTPDFQTSVRSMALAFGMRAFEGDGGVMVPRGIRKLRDLHTLRDVHIGRGNAVLQDIKRLTGLRKLGVMGINKKSDPAFCSAISSLSRLESLSLGSSAGKPGMCGCLDTMSSPPANLQSLKLYGNLETLPEWIKELQHLVKLKLVGTRLSENDSALKYLGRLPKLDILVLSGQSFEGDVLHFQSPQTENAFGNLRVLRLAYGRMRSSEFRMKSVKFDIGVMPKLELLQLQLSWVTNEVDISGLEVLPNINEVQLTVVFDIEQEKLRELRASSRQDKIWEEIDQQQKRKEGEYKNKIREQLDKNPNRPVLTWY